MSVQTGEIQPISSATWVVQEVDRKEAQSVPPVVKAEGSAAPQITEDKTSSASAPEAGFPPEVAKALQAFLKETMGIQLKFVVGGKGKTVVQVLDNNSGAVIRQIPSDTLLLFRDKLEELRGILFNGKA